MSTAATMAPSAQGFDRQAAGVPWGGFVEPDHHPLRRAGRHVHRNLLEPPVAELLHVGRRHCRQRRQRQNHTHCPAQPCTLHIASPMECAHDTPPPHGTYRCRPLAIQSALVRRLRRYSASARYSSQPTITTITTFPTARRPATATTVRTPARPSPQQACGGLPTRFAAQVPGLQQHADAGTQERGVGRQPMDERCQQRRRFRQPAVTDGDRGQAQCRDSEQQRRRAAPRADAAPVEADAEQGDRQCQQAVGRAQCQPHGPCRLSVARTQSRSVRANWVHSAVATNSSSAASASSAAGRARLMRTPPGAAPAIRPTPCDSAAARPHTGPARTAGNRCRSIRSDRALPAATGGDRDQGRTRLEAAIGGNRPQCTGLVQWPSCRRRLSRAAASSRWWKNSLRKMRGARSRPCRKRRRPARYRKPGTTPLLFGHAAVIGAEHRFRRGQDRHVAVQEQRGLGIDVVRAELAMAGSQQDQLLDPGRVDRGKFRCLRDRLQGQLRRTRLVVLSPRHIDRIVVERGQVDLGRLLPAWTVGNLLAVLQHRTHVAEVMVGTWWRRIAVLQRLPLRRSERQREKSMTGSSRLRRWRASWPFFHHTLTTPFARDPNAVVHSFVERWSTPAVDERADRPAVTAGCAHRSHSLRRERPPLPGAVMYRPAARSVLLALAALAAPSAIALNPDANEAPALTASTAASTIPTPQQVFAIPPAMLDMLHTQVTRRSYSREQRRRRWWR